MEKRVRALIIEEDKILLIKRVKTNLSYFVIPGGGVEAGESNEEALIRECREELGLDVVARDLILENILEGKEKNKQKEYFYLTSIISGKLGTGKGPEFLKNSKYLGTHEFKWLEIKNLLNVDLKPIEIKNLIYRKYNNIN